eukprot:30041-Pelagococcus_subviridis.AAC.5
MVVWNGHKIYALLFQLTTHPRPRTTGATFPTTGTPPFISCGSLTGATRASGSDFGSNPASTPDARTCPSTAFANFRSAAALRLAAAFNARSATRVSLSPELIALRAFFAATAGVSTSARAMAPSASGSGSVADASSSSSPPANAFTTGAERNARSSSARNARCSSVSSSLSTYPRSMPLSSPLSLSGSSGSSSSSSSSSSFVVAAAGDVSASPASPPPPRRRSPSAAIRLRLCTSSAAIRSSPARLNWHKIVRARPRRYSAATFLRSDSDAVHAAMHACAADDPPALEAESFSVATTSSTRAVAVAAASLRDRLASSSSAASAASAVASPPRPKSRSNGTPTSSSSSSSSPPPPPPPSSSSSNITSQTRSSSST